MQQSLREILLQLQKGEMDLDQAELLLKEEPVADLGYANLDLNRRHRQGMAEVIYGAGKTADQIAGIIDTMWSRGQGTLLVTRIDPDKYKAVADFLPSMEEDAAADAGNLTDGLHLYKEDLHYHKEASCLIIGKLPEPKSKRRIVVATGGTSDIPVAEEAALTIEVAGYHVTRLYDVGVAGIHRVLSHMDDIMTADVIIACAGMEGALASVIGGLSDCPVIAVPTSVGYGASFGGVSALLSMLNSCASGVTVVNIDNGFGAAMAGIKMLRRCDITDVNK